MRTAAAAALLLALAGPASADVSVSTAALRSHVDALTAGTPRSADHVERLRAVARDVAARLTNAGAPAVVVPYSFNGTDYPNVVARLNPGRGPVVVVGAHFDVAGNGPGADDNASGVAALIETARLVAPQAAFLPYEVQFAAFSNEEPPFFRSAGMGSYRMAAEFHGSGKRVALMISLEMVGYFSDAPGSQHYPSAIVSWGRPDKGNYIGFVSSLGKGRLLSRMKKAFLTATSLPVETIAAPRFVPGVDYSDHMNFWKFGFPAMMITDTAFYRNPNYHEPTDTPDTLDYGRMAEVVKGLAAFLRTYDPS